MVMILWQARAALKEPWFLFLNHREEFAFFPLLMKIHLKNIFPFLDKYILYDARQTVGVGKC